MEEIKMISLPLPFHLGSVNCYLIETGTRFVLIDTGGSNSRKELVHELQKSGCKPGFLDLIVLTHGDFDHTGNAAYLRSVFGCKIAMHADDLGMVAGGDMFVNRKKPNFLIRMLIPIFSRFTGSERFAPDVLLEDGDDLSGYGIDARTISIPGHSKGSLGILISGTDLFCGDLLVNTSRPALNSLIDEFASANASVQKLKSMGIATVYPGHGKPFPMHLLGKEPSLEERILDRVRYFNRRYFNPFALSFAGRRNSFWSAILHTGRRSGKEYITPVVAVRQNGCFVIPLPYGQKADWLKNVMAAGGCELIYRGKVFRTEKPEMFPMEEGLGAVPGWIKSRLRRLETKSMLRFNQITAASDGKERYQSFTTTYPLSRGLWVLAAIGFFAVGIGSLFTWRKASKPTTDPGRHGKHPSPAAHPERARFHSDHRG